MAEFVLFGIEGSRILWALAILAAWFIVGKIVYKVVKAICHAIASRTKNTLDDVLLQVLEGPVILLVSLGGIWFSFQSLVLQDSEITQWFAKIFTVVMIMGIAWLVTKVLSAIINQVLLPLTKKTKSSIDDQIMPLIDKAMKVIVWIFAMIIAASSLGFDVTALLAGVGVGGIAIAFAAQETIANIFGGISLIFDKTIQIGDFVKLDSGEQGNVKEITIRSTRLKTLDGDVIIVPNSVIAKSRITNYCLPKKFGRIILNIGVAYDSKPEIVEKTIKKALAGVKEVLKEPAPEVLFMEMGDFSLKFLIRLWIEGMENKEVITDKANRAVLESLGKAKIAIPFPTQTVLLKK